MSEFVLVNNRKGWSQVTLNRPDRLNALNEEMLERLSAILADLASNPACRAVLITGAGRGFCAGQDLTDCVPAPGKEPLDLALIMDRLYNPVIRLIRSMAKPVVCAVNGVAAGGGANLALAGDLVLAARSAKFIQPFTKIGLIPDCGGTFFLPRLVGEARARGLAFLAEPVSGEQAEDWGMIWRAVNDEDLAAQAEALATHLASQPTEALGLIKKAFAASSSNSLDDQLNLERDLQRQAAQTADHAEGVKAFMDKRPPIFTGR